MDRLRTFRSEESGVTSIEYALFAALIAAVIFVSVASVGNELRTIYGFVSNCVSGAVSGSPGNGC
jgi:pilus assembly protein Flp/PilA